MRPLYLRVIPFILISLILASPVPADENSVTMSFMGSSSSSTRSAVELRELPSHFFQNNPDAKVRGGYRAIYPGIDMACLGDDYSTEYIFSLQSGANPELISCFFRESTLVSFLHSGSVQFRKKNIQINVSKPIAYLQLNEGQDSIRQLKSRATADGHVSIIADELLQETQQHLNGTIMNLVPGGGQPSGPMHDFFTSKLETSNEQLLYFLNDAEANQMNARGANMHFDKYGDIWINPAKKMARDEMFSVANSKLIYDPAKPVGHRYDHMRDPDDRPLYAAHPAMGLSWYGAIKYCNWLTLHSKRGTSALCYTEGTNTFDWTPATATNWANGSFTELERYEWLKLKGFRLPMTGTNSPLLEPNAFNEFYKAAAWNSFTNLSFGFGSDGCDGTSANFKNTMFHTAAGTLPAGFFSKDNESLFKDLTPSANFYGLFDLSGNAAEWTTDGNGSEMATCGGSWSDPPLPADTCYFLPPYYTAKSVGMRVSSAYMPDFQIRIHLLVTFFLLEEDLPPLDMPEANLFPYIPPSAPPPGAAIAVDTHSGTSASITGSQSPTDYVTPGGITYRRNEVVPPPFIPPTETPDRPEDREEPPLPPITPPPWIPDRPPGPTTTTTTTTTTSTTTTTLPPGPTRTLLVRSSNPGSGVWITVTPDSAGNGAAFTPYSRIYSNAASVTLNAPIMAGLNTFQRWQRNGVDVSTNQTLNFLMLTDNTVIAVYMYVPGVIVDPDPSPSGI